MRRLMPPWMLTSSWTRFLTGRTSSPHKCERLSTWWSQSTNFLRHQKSSWIPRSRRRSRWSSTRISYSKRKSGSRRTWAVPTSSSIPTPTWPLSKSPRTSGSRTYPLILIGNQKKIVGMQNIAHKLECPALTPRLFMESSCWSNPHESVSIRRKTYSIKALGSHF